MREGTCLPPAEKLERAARAAALAAEVLVAAALAAQDPGGAVDAGELLVRAMDRLGESAAEIYALLLERPHLIA